MRGRIDSERFGFKLGPVWYERHGPTNAMNDPTASATGSVPAPAPTPTGPVLIAEDDDGHVELIYELLQEVGVGYPVVRLRDGQELLDYFGPSETAGPPAPAPRLLLLDIRLPKVDGIEVLRHLARQARKRRFPVVMLTTTDDPREMEKCYRLGCDGYVTKPVDTARFAAMLRQLGCLGPAPQAPVPAVPPPDSPSDS